MLFVLWHHVSRRGPGQEYVKSTLGDIILKLIAYDHSLEVDPLKIYQEMIDNEEVERPAEANKLLLEVWLCGWGGVLCVSMRCVCKGTESAG